MPQVQRPNFLVFMTDQMQSQTLAPDIHAKPQTSIV